MIILKILSLCWPNLSYSLNRDERPYSMVSLAAAGLKMICSIRSIMLFYLTSTSLTFISTEDNSPSKNMVTLQRVSLRRFWQAEKNNLARQYCCSSGVMVIKCTKDLAESSLTALSARMSTLRMVSKCHLLL